MPQGLDQPIQFFTTPSSLAIIATYMSDLIAELWRFFKVRKKFWLTPIILFLALLSLLIVFAESSAVAPFIYTLF